MSLCPHGPLTIAEAVQAYVARARRRTRKPLADQMLELNRLWQADGISGFVQAIEMLPLQEVSGVEYAEFFWRPAQASDC